MSRDKYIEHISDKSQYNQMRRILDKAEIVSRNYETEHTDFLDPYQIRLAESILNRFDIGHYAEGGAEQSERKTVVMFPDYLSKDDIENPVTAIKIEGSFKFNEVSHKDYLGAIMGIGIKREKIGDIYVGSHSATVIVQRDILDYIIANLERIGKERVKIVEIPLSDIVVPETEYEEKTVVASSNRLDLIISEAYGISRAKSKSLVSSEMVKVNWAPVLEPSFKLSIRDLVSVRKMGRFILEQSMGTTKKEKERLKIKLYK